MKIERWCAYRKNGEFAQGGFDSEELAKKAANEYDLIAVKLEGELPEKKKKVLMAPALCRDECDTYRTLELFNSEREAKQMYRDDFVCWPAPVPNSEGFYEIEVPSE